MATVYIVRHAEGKQKTLSFGIMEITYQPHTTPGS
jgi:hypothetical protein